MGRPKATDLRPVINDAWVRTPQLAKRDASPDRRDASPDQRDASPNQRDASPDRVFTQQLNSFKNPVKTAPKTCVTQLVECLPFTRIFDSNR